jgi:hypothetical protein
MAEDWSRKTIPVREVDDDPAGVIFDRFLGDLRHLNLLKGAVEVC